MLATFCACCGKELVDAQSVEAGMGPVCRKRHGYTKPQGEPDVDAARVALGPALADRVRLDPEDTRGTANRIVHAIACDQYGADVNAFTNALAALGYTKLAARVAKRVVAVHIERDGHGIIVRAPYREDMIAAWRRLPGRRWDRDAKANVVPHTSGAALLQLLREHFAGLTAEGPKGLFLIEAA